MGRPERNLWVTDPTFMARVEFDDLGCWLWTGTLNRDGYGEVSREGRTQLAHVWSYLSVKGVPDKETLDHRCRVRRCVNPDHLVPETRVDNAWLAPNFTGNRTHCPRGHPYSAENTIRKNGRRVCRTCRNAQERTRRARRRSESA